MSSWHEFLSMGGFGAYVWPSYAAVFALMVLNAALPVRRLRALQRELQRRARAGRNPP